MPAAAIPPNEAARLKALHRYEILDTGAEAEFDDFTRLAARICGTPVAQITFVDRGRQWYKSNFGVDLVEVPREIGFCAHTILSTEVLEVPDMRLDDRFRDNPLVMHAPEVRFYAGAPLTAPDGSGVGSLCVIDLAPKMLTDEQRDALAALSRQVVRQLELRIAVKREQVINDTLAKAAVQLQAVNADLQGLVSNRDERLASAEAQVRHLQKVESISLLAGGVVHDVNNLLTIINGTAELVAMQLAPQDPAQRDLDNIAATGRKAAAVTKQLLRFSQQLPAQSVEIDLNATVATMHALLSRLIDRRIEIVAETARDALLILGDPSQVDQLLLNLVVNARDAMPSGGRLCIRTERLADGRAGLVVGDTGVGMDQETVARIFEPFFTTKGEGKGTGLGLSTVRDIVSRANGTIAVESAPGVGTTFTVTLPTVGAP